MRIRILILVFVILGCGHGAAQTVHIGEREYLFFGGVEYDSVVGFNVAACACLLREHPGHRMCSHDFWILQVEGGSGGGKLQFGIGAWHFLGAMAKASILRTWGETMQVAPSQTYVGIEVSLNLFQIHSDIGLYQRISGEDDDDDTLVLLGVGVGF